MGALEKQTDSLEFPGYGYSLVTVTFCNDVSQITKSHEQYTIAGLPLNATAIKEMTYGILEGNDLRVTYNTSRVMACEIIYFNITNDFGYNLHSDKTIRFSQETSDGLNHKLELNQSIAAVYKFTLKVTLKQGESESTLIPVLLHVCGLESMTISSDVGAIKHVIEKDKVDSNGKFATTFGFFLSRPPVNDHTGGLSISECAD